MNDPSEQPANEWDRQTFGDAGADQFDDPAAATKELPPVEPPSAGFIVQLFVIPAIIVMAVLGVWLLFGQLASGELDWRRAVANIKSENPHIRWRAAMTLSDMLDVDRVRGAEGQQLAENAEIARALAGVYEEFLSQSQFTEEERNQMEYLSKALGRLNVPDVVNPVLLSAMQHEDEDIRRQSLIAASMIAGFAQERGEPFDDADMIAEAIDLSYSDTSLIRQSAVFFLGLADAESAQPRLEALLDHGDRITRINAAIGLARSGSTAGLPVFASVMEEAIENPPHEPARQAPVEEGQKYLNEINILENTIKAVDLLQETLSEEEQTAWADRLERLAEAIENDATRLQALQTREELRLGTES